MDRNSAIVRQKTRIIHVATREGGVDRNMNDFRRLQQTVKSPPARVAWIETFLVIIFSRSATVVATREGGVDRNAISFVPPCVLKVATREGGVDRNCGGIEKYIRRRMSPPARVAWIETSATGPVIAS